MLGKPRLLALVFDEKYLSHHVRHVGTVGNEETDYIDWNDINVFLFGHKNAVQHYECSDPNQTQRENLSFENTPLFGKLSLEFGCFLRK